MKLASVNNGASVFLSAYLSAIPPTELSHGNWPLISFLFSFFSHFSAFTSKLDISLRVEFMRKARWMSTYFIMLPYISPALFRVSLVLHPSVHRRFLYSVTTIATFALAQQHICNLQSILTHPISTSLLPSPQLSSHLASPRELPYHQLSRLLIYTSPSSCRHGC